MLNNHIERRRKVNAAKYVFHQKQKVLENEMAFVIQLLLK